MLLNRINHPIVFIQNVLAGIESEKDPRNLLICFDLTYFMLVTYMSPDCAFYRETAKEVLEQLEESFFDEIACYFPIQFKPPKNDTHKITPEQLQQALAKCMLATPTLLQHLVPHLLEKMGALQTNTKVACLHLFGQIAETFSLQQLVEPGTTNQLLVQVLSQVSNVFFNVIEERIQEKASWTIAVTLGRLLSENNQFSTAASQTGITFVSANSKDSRVGHQAEVLDFIKRCMDSIEESPESMQAGLSSLLLKTIAVTSETLQELIAVNVYLYLVAQVCNSEVRIVNQIAYLSVLTSLTEAVASDAKVYRPLIKLTLQDQRVCGLLEQIIKIILTSREPDQMDQNETVRFEKLLYVYCAIKDLQERCPEPETIFFPAEIDS